jgi:hypothetical protein
VFGVNHLLGCPGGVLWDGDIGLVICTRCCYRRMVMSGVSTDLGNVSGSVARFHVIVHTCQMQSIHVDVVDATLRRSPGMSCRTLERNWLHQEYFTGSAAQFSWNERVSRKGTNY